MKNTAIALSIFTAFSLVSEIKAQDMAMGSSANSQVELRVSNNNDMMKAARDYSVTGEGIGIFMLAGQDYKGVTVENINRMFNNSVAKHNVKVKVFVEWALEREFSLFKASVFGEGVGVQANIQDFSIDLQEALKRFKAKKRLKMGELKP